MPLPMAGGSLPGAQAISPGWRQSARPQAFFRTGREKNRAKAQVGKGSLSGQPCVCVNVRIRPRWLA